MDSETFLIWPKHVITGWSLNTNQKLGRHRLDKGRWSDYVIITPHTTHKLQPLDVSVFKPLQTYCDQDKVETWLGARPGRGITTFRISQLLGASYIKAATMVNAVNGFIKAGIWPCDRHVFDQEFEADTETPPQSTVGL